MAEKPDDQVTTDEKITKAKELYARGCRNYYVKSYAEAADDLSEATKLYAEVYGVDGEELGEVFLLYAKALVSLGQEENKLIEVPENEDEDEPVEEDDGEAEPEIVEDEEASSEKTNGHSNGTEEEAKEPEAGPSSEAVTTTSSDNEDSNQADGEGNENEDDGGNLEVAWEVLQNAALIFQRQEDSGLANLLEVYNEMAGISMENGNFALAMDDFTRALTTFSMLDDDKKNDRIAAEINYKMGLCQTMEKLYDESVKSFQSAVDLLAGVIEIEKAREEQTEEVLAKIKDLEETQQEILNKITEIGEVKTEEIEQVKKELSKLYGMNGTSAVDADGAGCSSSSVSNTLPIKSPEADKPKPTDISHLIKRKKPDSTETVENSPAKKKIIETSPGEKVAVPVEESKDKVVEEDAGSVVVVDNN